MAARLHRDLASHTLSCTQEQFPKIQWPESLKGHGMMVWVLHMLFCHEICVAWDLTEKNDSSVKLTVVTPNEKPRQVEVKLGTQPRRG